MIPNFLKHPATLAVVGVALVFGTYLFAVRSMGLPDPCKKVSQQMTFVGQGILSMGDDQIVCAYNVQEKKWQTLVAPAPAPEAAPAQ